MSDRPEPHRETQRDGKLEKAASAGDWPAAETAAQNLAKTPEGRKQLEKAFQADPSLLPHLMLDDKLGRKSTFATFDSNNDGKLSSNEVEKALKEHKATEAQSVMLASISKNFYKMAGLDGDARTISVKDLEESANTAEARRVAVALQKWFPNGGDAKLTEEQITAAQKRLEARVSSEDFAKLPLAEQDEINNSKRVVDYLADSRKFYGLSDTKSFLTQRNIDDFVTATLNPSKKDGAAEITFHALTDKLSDNDNKIFDLLASPETVNSTQEQRISQKNLAESINKMNRDLKNGIGDTARNREIVDVLLNLNENFSKITSANSDGGNGISLKDLEAYRQLQAPTLANDLDSLFGKKLETGISQADVASKLQSEKPALLSDPNNAELKRHIKLLQNLQNGGFEAIAQAGQPSDPPGAPIPPNRVIDLADLKAIEKERVDLLALPTDRKKAKSNEVIAEVPSSVNALFKDSVTTKVDGQTELKLTDTRTGKTAIADYGTMKIGYRYDSEGHLDGVFYDPLSNPKNNPGGHQPQVFEKVTDAEGKTHWYARPNGIGNPVGQHELPGEQYVDAKGTFKQMLIGEMDNNHKPLANSSHRTLTVKDGIVYNTIVATNGSAFSEAGHFGQSKPESIFFKTSEAADWQALTRQGTSENFAGKVKVPGRDQPVDFTISNPKVSNYVFSYTTSGQRFAHTTDGLRLNESAQKRVYNDNGAYGGFARTGGGLVEFTRQGNDIASLKIAETRSKQTRYFDPVVDEHGKQKEKAGVPLWLSYSKDAHGIKKNAKEETFKLKLDASGVLTDTGRSVAPLPGYNFDHYNWNKNVSVYVPENGKGQNVYINGA
jgi:hypothetical protein